MKIKFLVVFISNMVILITNISYSGEKKHTSSSRHYSGGHFIIDHCGTYMQAVQVVLTKEVISLTPEHKTDTIDISNNIQQKLL